MSETTYIIAPDSSPVRYIPVPTPPPLFAVKRAKSKREPRRYQLVTRGLMENTLHRR